MARIRTIKPAFFKHEELAELSKGHRLLFVGLWTLADREGRLEDRPKRIRAEVFPYEDDDVDGMLGELAGAGFLVRYEALGKRFIAIPSFKDHQRITGTEAKTPSAIPAPPSGNTLEIPSVSSDTTPNPSGNTSAVESQGNTDGDPKCFQGNTSDDWKGKGKGVREGKGETDRVRDASTGSAWGPSPARARKWHCAFESAIGVDVPQQLHEEFVAKLANAGTYADPSAELLKWYPTVEAHYIERKAVVPDDAWRFWRKEFAEAIGKTSARPRGGYVPPAPRAKDCPHTPTCPDSDACIDLQISTRQKRSVSA